MSKRPSMLDTIADMSAKGDASRSTKSDVAKSTKTNALKEAKSDVAESIPRAPELGKPIPGKPLPKVTLYAHADVLKSIRLLAVEDGVQAQEILRTAVRAYLAQRGHTFTDLATGERA